MLRIYNTFTGKKEILKPINNDEVRIYVCGITAYDDTHIGHARSSLVFDVVRRYLNYRGFRTYYVQNFTDVDDKIVKRAVQENSTQRKISERYIKRFFEDMRLLNVIPADVHPRVTDNMDYIIQSIKGLIEGGYAYRVDGDVYFHVPSFREYGKLARIDPGDMVHRIEPDRRKKDVRDFALWKSATEEDIMAEAFFESPWGKGRPGWHIECTALTSKYLGIPFDIHGGGKDLIFPHHENERAQTKALTGHEPANYWMHNEFVMIHGEKMSKSLGNILPVRKAVRETEPEVIRLFLISRHYRSPVDYTGEGMKEAEKIYERLKNTAENLGMEVVGAKKGLMDEIVRERADDFVKRFEMFMDDDFNTPGALRVILGFSRYINSIISRKNTRKTFTMLYEKFMSLCWVFGLLQDQKIPPELTDEELSLIREREEARRKRDFRRADEIREMFLRKGIQLIDTPAGTRWKTVE